MVLNAKSLVPTKQGSSRENHTHQQGTFDPQDKNACYQAGSRSVGLDAFIVSSSSVGHSLKGYCLRTAEIEGAERRFHFLLQGT